MNKYTNVKLGLKDVDVKNAEKIMKLLNLPNKDFAISVALHITQCILDKDIKEISLQVNGEWLKYGRLLSN